MPVDLIPAGLPIVARASLVEDGGPLKAWVERVVRKDPDIRWIVGNYVEADVPNDNGHTFPLADLQAAQHTVAGKPLNMLHRDHYIVGAFAGAQLVGPDGKELQAAYDPDGEERGHPYVEAVAGMWHTRFPEEYFNIQRAHKEGTLFFSMEAVPEEVSCPTCAHRSVFAGLESDSYCEHMQGAVGPKVLHNPVFAGGAIIIPPVRPGWSRADVKTISKLVNANQSPAESLFAQLQREAPDLDEADLEAMMLQIMSLYHVCEMMEDDDDMDEMDEMPMSSMALAGDYSAEQRRQMAKNGQAMKDGSFPIKNVQDLKDAIQSIGRSKNPGAARAHIIKRARALGQTALIPEEWKS